MGNMVRARIGVLGTRALWQHQFGPEALPLEKGERTGVAGNDPEEWKKTCMVTADGQLYIRPDYIFGCIRNGARHTKKNRGNMMATVAATLQVEDTIILLDRFVPPEKELTRDPTAPVYLDVRGVRNPSTKGRNVRYRLAASPGWRCSFTITWDKTLVAREVMRAILNDSGILGGLGDGVSIGMGRFKIATYEELSDAEETPSARTVEPQAANGVAERRKAMRAVPEAVGVE